MALGSGGAGWSDRVTDENRSADLPPSEPDPGMRRGQGELAPNAPAEAPPDPVSGRIRRNWRTSGKRAGSGRRGDAPAYAALDLGTNNCRLLIARPTPRSFRVVDGYSRIVRLGEAVSHTGRLGEDAIERTLEALGQCKARLENHNVRASRLIATEACRAAVNAEAFLERVREEIGFALEVVDHRTEAELAVTGCADLVDREATGVLLFDIGGGSSELAWLDFRGGRPKSRGKMAAAIRCWWSLPVGVVSIAEKFGGHHVTPESFELMVAHVGERLTQLRGREKLARAVRDHPMHLVGTSGTVTTLAGLHLGLERYDRSRVDGLWMADSQVAETTRALVGMSYRSRVDNACIGHDRADLVIPGCAILEAIRRQWPCDRIRVADRGLREGILISLMAEDRVWSRGGGARRSRRRRRPAPSSHE